MNSKYDVLVIMGPTCSGKSSFAIECAKVLDGEIISADSMQIYKEMSIGTAKIKPNEMQGIAHYLIDHVSVFDEYSAQQYKNDTLEKIKEIQSRNKTPIIVGGTGLFVKGLVHDYDYANSPKNQKLREKYLALANEKGLEWLYELLKSKDYARAMKIKPTDEKRIVRALEIIDQNNNATTTNPQKKLSYQIVALETDRQALYEKINLRVDEMLKQGLLEEVKSIYEMGIDENSQSFKGIGYKEFIPYFNNEKTYQDCVDTIKQHTRNYAKRQLTWLRGMDNVIWLKPNEHVKACKIFRGESND